jgi:hypothetical protein
VETRREDTAGLPDNPWVNGDIAAVSERQRIP